MGEASRRRAYREQLQSKATELCETPVEDYTPSKLAEALAILDKGMPHLRGLECNGMVMSQETAEDFYSRYQINVLQRDQAFAFNQVHQGYKIGTIRIRTNDLVPQGRIVLLHGEQMIGVITLDEDCHAV